MKKIVLIICLACASVCAGAQSKNLNGHWSIKEKTLIQGKEISDDIPVEIELRQWADSIKISRYLGTDRIGEQLLTTKGTPNRLDLRNGQERNALINLTTNGFKEEWNVTDKIASGQILYHIQETWTMTDDRNLVVERDYHSISDNYRIRAQYQRD